MSTACWGWGTWRNTWVTPTVGKIPQHTTSSSTQSLFLCQLLESQTNSKRECFSIVDNVGIIFGSFSETKVIQLLWMRKCRGSLTHFTFPACVQTCTVAVLSVTTWLASVVVQYKRKQCQKQFMLSKLGNKVLSFGFFNESKVLTQPVWVSLFYTSAKKQQNFWQITIE